MKIDLLKIIADAKKIYYDRNSVTEICSAIRWSIIDYERQYISKLERSYIPDIENHMCNIFGCWWELDFDECIEYFSKPENRYLVV